MQGRNAVRVSCAATVPLPAPSGHSDREPAHEAKQANKRSLGYRDGDGGQRKRALGSIIHCFSSSTFARLISPFERPFKVGVQIVDVVHDDLAAGETHHAFVEPTVAHGLDEFFLAERFHALEQRGADQPLLIGAVTAIAGGGTPGTKAVHGLRIDLVAIDHRV